MSWTISEDLTAFERAATAFLRARAMENSVPITVAAALRRRGPDAYGTQPPLFGWWRPDDGSAVAAAFIRTPPHPPLLPRGELTAARELAAAWPAQAPPPGVRGDRESAEAFGAAWHARTGAEVTVERTMRLYRLGRLIPRDPAPPGRARVCRLDLCGVAAPGTHACRVVVGRRLPQLPLGGAPTASPPSSALHPHAPNTAPSPTEIHTTDPRPGRP
jgi:hypothetical protein